MSTKVKKNEDFYDEIYIKKSKELESSFKVLQDQSKSPNNLPLIDEWTMLEKYLNQIIENSKQKQENIETIKFKINPIKFWDLDLKPIFESNELFRANTNVKRFNDEYLKIYTQAMSENLSSNERSSILSRLFIVKEGFVSLINIKRKNIGLTDEKFIEELAKLQIELESI